MEEKSTPFISKETRRLYEIKMQSRKQKNSMQKIKLLVRETLKNNFDKRVIGVFGDYTYRYEDDQTGSNVIEIIAVELAKSHPEYLIITGKYNYVYHAEIDDVVKDDGLNTVLNDEVIKKTITNIHYSRILSGSCQFAVFLITLSRTTSIIEEEEFLDNEFGDKLFGLGACIFDSDMKDSDVNCGCFDVSEHNFKDNEYYFICKKILRCNDGCQGFFHKTKHGLSEPFINNHLTKLIATKHWKIIPKIFNGYNTRQS